MRRTGSRSMMTPSTRSRPPHLAHAITSTAKLRRRRLADDADMLLQAAAARHQLGLLLGGAEGALELRQAEEAMRAQDVRVPAKFAGLYVPGRWG